VPSSRPSKQIQLHRESEAWRLTLCGWNQTQIGKKLGITQQAVSLILDRVQKREAAALAKNFHEGKAKQFAQLGHYANEAIKAWHKSKQPGNRVRQSDSGGGGDGTTVTEAFNREGNVAYLHTGMKAMAQQAEIAGYNVEAASQEVASAASVAIEAMEKRGNEDSNPPAPGTADDAAGDAPEARSGVDEVQDGSQQVQP
jgi:predicted DNA-binding protein (UPF0251 family)